MPRAKPRDEIADAPVRVAEIAFRSSSQAILSRLGADWTSLSVLTRALGIRKPSVLRPLAALMGAGLVEERERITERGKEKEYRAIPFSIHWEKRGSVSISWASPGELPWRIQLLHQIPPGESRDELSNALEIIRREAGNRLRFVVLFGSVARGEGTWKSNLDLIVATVGDVAASRERIRDALADAAPKFTHRVSPIYTTPDEFRVSQAAVFEEAREHGILILGEHPAEVDAWGRIRRYTSSST